MLIVSDAMITNQWESERVNFSHLHKMYAVFMGCDEWGEGEEELVRVCHEALWKCENHVKWRITSTWCWQYFQLLSQFIGKSGSTRLTTLVQQISQFTTLVNFPSLRHWIWMMECTKEGINTWLLISHHSMHFCRHRVCCVWAEEFIYS